MNTEIMEHAARILRGEPTRTSSARALHQRVVVELGFDVSYTRFIEMLAGRPDRFAIVTDGKPFGNAAPLIEHARHAAHLERAGLLRSATVLLTELEPFEPPGVAHDELTAALRATLADAHETVLDLLQLDRDGGVAADAVLELDQLRGLGTHRPRRAR